VHELSERLPRDAVACCDAGENRLYMATHYRTGAVNGFLQPAGIGGMGFAIPAALGAKLAEPHRMAVAVCGDGGFAMAMNGLMTAVEERLPILVVVLNNRMLGWVRHGQGDRVIAAEFDDFDLAAIARAIGCNGQTVRTPDELTAAIDVAVEHRDVPTVLDVRISQQSSFLETLSPYASRDWSLLVPPVPAPAAAAT
jgi:acetolactate synthase-1/2/3 large subunit